MLGGAVSQKTWLSMSLQPASLIEKPGEGPICTSQWGEGVGEAKPSRMIATKLSVSIPSGFTAAQVLLPLG